MESHALLTTHLWVRHMKMNQITQNEFDKLPILLNGLWVRRIKMNQITQKEFDKLPIINGLRVCPKSDFSQIKFLGKVVIADWSIIGNESQISDDSIIGNFVKIGNHVKIGDFVEVGNHVEIGDFVEVGNRVKIGTHVEIGHHVEIGNYVAIGNHVKIGFFAKIGNHVKIGNHMKVEYFAEVGKGLKFGAFPTFGWRRKFKIETIPFEDKGGYPIPKIDISSFEYIGFEYIGICFYNLMSGIYVRDGCFLGTTEEFIEKTRSDGDAKKLEEYMMMVQMAELGFSN